MHEWLLDSFGCSDGSCEGRIGLDYLHMIMFPYILGIWAGLCGLDGVNKIYSTVWYLVYYQ